jgi:hypothetical protein
MWPFVALYPSLCLIGLALGRSEIAGYLALLGTVFANVLLFLILGFLYRRLSAWRNWIRIPLVCLAYSAIFGAAILYAFS